MVHLNEPKSAFDATSEAKVGRVLKAAMQGRTTSVVAHGLTTIWEADEVLLFVEVGSSSADSSTISAGRTGASPNLWRRRSSPWPAPRSSRLTSRPARRGVAWRERVRSSPSLVGAHSEEATMPSGAARPALWRVRASPGSNISATSW
jgi:hypothetical protein